MRRVPALAVAFTLLAASGMAQERSEQPARSALIGLPVVTSDGREIGRVTDAVSEPQDEPMLIAEIERPSAIGPHVVSIPIDMFVQRADRIELTITFEEVNGRLEGPEHEP
jgi:sporulation protein YlmC with PRC-barrel domain